MEIDRLSASAMQVLEACPSRFKANQAAGRIGEPSGRPAMIGTTCHYGAEHFVKNCIQEAKYAPTLETLLIFLQHGYIDTFGNSDFSSKEYKECEELMRRWWARTSFEGFRVISTEEKLNFIVKTSQGDRPFNFIFDRFDQLEETVFRVVDYKSLSRPLSPQDLRDKLQARAYGLAVQIMHPEATRVWVMFDMWRWEAPIATAFDREDNIETYRRIQRAFEVGFKIPEDAVPEKLNDECGWCVKKTTCKALQANQDAGGLFGASLEEIIDTRARLKIQATAAKNATDELDKILLKHMEKNQVVEVVTENFVAKAVSRGDRSVDAGEVEQLIGTKMFQRYGGEANITMKDFDALLKDPELDGAVRASLEQLVVKKYGAPYISTKDKK